MNLNSSRNLSGWSVTLIALWPFATSCGLADDPGNQDASGKLTEIRDLVGAWRGVGQPRRGSTRGAWQEEILWHFHFDEGHASLECDSTDSRWLTQASLQGSAQAGQYELQLRDDKNDATRRYEGTKSEEGAFIFATEKPVSGLPDRITIRLVADGDRLVVLYETRGDGDRYSRLAEVGYTRHGANFGQESYPECIVTGGRGTIPLEHGGKTYYVCCRGCRELFLESPDEIIAEYQRKKAEAGKTEAK